MTLSIKTLTRSALVILVREWSGEAQEFRPGIQRWTEGCQQKHVDFILPRDADRVLKVEEIEDLNVSLDEFEQRFLLPAVTVLAKAIPGRVRFLELELPQGIESHGETRDNVFVRGCLDLNSLNVSGVGYQTILRFDVLFEPAE